MIGKYKKKNKIKFHQKCTYDNNIQTQNSSRITIDGLLKNQHKYSRNEILNLQ